MHTIILDTDQKVEAWNKRCASRMRLGDSVMLHTRQCPKCFADLLNHDETECRRQVTRVTDNIREINIKKPNPGLVRQLKLLLKDAEEGVIVGIAGAVYYHDGSTGEHWVEPPETYSESLTADRMQGCFSRLSFMLHCRALGVDISGHITVPPAEDPSDADE